MCPVCGRPLVLFELEGVEIDRCLDCGGTWLDAGELEQLAALAGASAGRLSEALGKARGGRAGVRRCLRCPARLRVIRVEEVEIDACPRGHGFWFDRAEVRKLIGAFEEGEEGAVARFFAEFFRAELDAEQTKGG